MKKIFFISVTLLILTILFLVIYNFVFKKPKVTAVPVPITVEEIPTPIPQTVTKKISHLTNTRALSAVLYGEESIRYVDVKSRSFMQMSIRGTAKTELANPSIDLSRVEWSSDGTGAILSTKSGSIYSITDDTWSARPFLSTSDYARFARQDKAVIHKTFNKASGGRKLVLTNTVGEEPRELATIPFRRVSFDQVPEAFLIAFWPEPDAFVGTNLFTVGTISAAEPKSTFSGVFGADFRYSPDGEKILMSNTLTEGGSKTTLGYMDNTGRNYNNLRIPTFVSKAIWSLDGKTVYYAQPTNIPTGSILPNDYDTEKFMTADTFWKVDIATGEKDRLIELEDLPEEIDATNLMLLPDNTALFFINRTNGNIYRMNL